MSDEFEGAEGSVGSENTGSESVDSSGSAGEAGQSASPQQSQVTMDLLQEALSGVSGQWSEQFQGLSQSQQRLAAKLERFLEGQQKQQEKPVLPDDPSEFELRDTQDLHKVLKGITNKYEEKLGKIENYFKQEQQSRQEQQLSSQYYNYLDTQTKSAIEKIPLFQDPAMTTLLKQQVAAKIYSSGGDIKNLNIMNIAQGLAKQIQTVAENLSRGNKQAKPNVFPMRKGSATKPGKAKRDINNLSDFDKAFDEELGPMLEAMAGED